MNILAFIPVYNEEDIIHSTISYLINQGIYVYILDNWSNDSSIEIIKSFNSKYIINIEKNPFEKTNEMLWDLDATSKRICRLSIELNFDWYIWHDSDEHFQGIWNYLNLKESIEYVDHEGFNAISFKLLTFHPVDNNFQFSDIDYISYFKYYSPSYCVPDCRWVRIWKKQSKVWFHGGSHEVKFLKRRIFPEKFIIRHYPIRSQMHGEKKVFNERLPRYSEKGKRRGWHIQYNNLNKSCNFLKKRSDLIEYHDEEFKKQF